MRYEIKGLRDLMLYNDLSLTAHCAKRPACPGRACPELLVLSLSKGSKGPGELACPEFIEWVEGLTAYRLLLTPDT
jgi:hypothetical protein